MYHIYPYYDSLHHVPEQQPGKNSWKVVSYAGCQLAVAPPRLRADKQLVLRAVQQNGCALEYAAESLKVRVPGCIRMYAS